MDFIRNTLAGLSSCHESSSHVNPLQLFEDRLARAEKELSSLRNSQAKRDAGPIVLTQTGRATSALEEGLDRAVLLDPNQALNSTQRDFGVASGSAVTSKCRIILVSNPQQHGQEQLRQQEVTASHLQLALLKIPIG
ncbi:hypothetical protein WJX84_011221 [Apatococcus fuscideae]|uniref:Uncharacterized protein n=1 Tax=Apatococcus fuscideae TaxID=2026836 RepID=A0AAW1SH22_9CHLO